MTPTRIIPAGLPSVVFAHSYAASAYENAFAVRDGFIEITLITEGRLTFRSGGQAASAERGDLVCNLHLLPSAVAAAGDHGHQTVGFAMPFLLSEGPDPRALTIPYILHTGGRASAVRDLISDVIRVHTLSPDDPAARCRCAGLILCLLSEVSAAAEQEAHSDAYSLARYARRAEDYVFNHLSEPIRQGDIAAHLGITPEYLCTVFRRVEGVPVMTYVNRVKLDRLRTVMQKEHIPLNHACELCGFSDPNYVSRLYRKLYGMSLTEALGRE